jgi:hypothetical protein
MQKWKAHFQNFRSPWIDLLGILTQPPTTPQKILPCPYMKLNHPLKPPLFGHDSWPHDHGGHIHGH